MKLRMFPGIVFALLGVNIAIVATTIFYATGDPSFAVDPAYYHQIGSNDPAVVYAASSTRQPTWDVRITASEPDGTPHRFVTLDLHDEQGRSLHDVVISARAFHNARAGRPVELRFEPLGIGTGRFSCRLHDAWAGRWTMHLDISCGNDHWTSSTPFTVISAEAGQLFQLGGEEPAQ